MRIYPCSHVVAYFYYPFSQFNEIIESFCVSNYSSSFCFAAIEPPFLTIFVVYSFLQLRISSVKVSICYSETFYDFLRRSLDSLSVLQRLTTLSGPSNSSQFAFITSSKNLSNTFIASILFIIYSFSFFKSSKRFF